MTIFLDQLAATFVLMLIYTVFIAVLGYYLYKYQYLPSLEQTEPSFAQDIKELTDNISTGFKQALSAVKVDIDFEKITENLTNNFYATFLAILGVNLENPEEVESFNFAEYIKRIIDTSVQDVVPETIKGFEQILPEFADQFIEGIQKALSGVVETIPEGASKDSIVQQVAGAAPDLDMGKMIQMVFMQWIMKQMGGGGNINLGSLLGSGASAPISTGRSSF